MTSAPSSTASTVGEFIVKNLVLLAAGLVVGSTVRGGRSRVRVETDGEES